FEHWLEPVFESVVPATAAAEEAHGLGLEVGLALVSVAVALIGFVIAYSTYCKKSDRAERVSAQFRGLYNALLNKWYVDELYDALFVNRAKDLGRGLWRFDGRIVDGLVNNAAFTTVKSALG